MQSRDGEAFLGSCVLLWAEISDRENVPVGLIDTAWGGTPVDAFLSLEGLTGSSAVLPALAYRAKAANAIADYPAMNAADKREDDAAKAAGLLRFG